MEFKMLIGLDCSETEKLNSLFNFLDFILYNSDCEISMKFSVKDQASIHLVVYP